MIWRIWRLRRPLIIYIRLKRYTPIFVCQMGKVGSTSIWRSLKACLAQPIYHGHSVHPNQRFLVLRMLHRFVVAKGRPIKVIVLTREPIARNISAFFDNFERYVGVPFEQSNHSIDELIRLFWERFNHDEPLVWFDNVVEGSFGIDVYQEPFPKYGVATYQKGNTDLIVMRSELPDEQKAAAIATFLGLDAFHIRNENVGEDKPYAATYQAFKQTVELPLAYLERLHGSKYFQHFYEELPPSWMARPAEQDAGTSYHA